MFAKTIFSVLTPALICPSVSAAEFEGSVLFWGQAIRGATSSSKFEEYEDVPRGFFVESLDLALDRGNYYFLIDGRKPGLRDQRVDLETGEWGMHKLSFTYDQIPHNLSNTARSFLRNDGDGRFTLPDNMQSSMESSTANANGFLPWSPSVPLRVDRRQGNFSYTYAPVGKWRMRLGYQSEKRDGQKATGVSYGHSQLQEALEPVDYQIHNFNIGTEYAAPSVGFTAGYQFSAFENNIKALTVDNPFKLNDAAVSGSGSSAPGKARLALPPDNQTHQANLGFNAKTSARSRLSADFSFTAQLQNDPFLPLTSNQNIAAHPAFPALPQDSLDGKAYIWNGLAKWNLKPTDKSSFNLFAKYYNFDNKSPSLTFEQYIPYDGAISTSTPTTSFNPTRSRTSLPIGYDKTNLGTDLYYSFFKELSMKLGYEWERWGRDFRESNVTKEDIYTVSFNFKPVQSLMIRPGYQYGRKVVENYSAHHVAEETFPLGEGTGVSGQLDDLRKYDQAGRKRHKATVRADWDLSDSVNTGLDWGWILNDFTAAYGLEDEKTFYYSVDAGYNPSEDLKLYADYTFERMTSHARSRNRSPSNDSSVNDWTSTLKDTVHTVSAGAGFNLVKDVLDADIGGSVSYAKGQQSAITPDPAATLATASDFPNTYNRLSKARATLRYKIVEALIANLRYEYQRYTESDWSQETLDVYQTIWNKSVFLGATQPDFHAHIVSLGLSYQF